MPRRLRPRPVPHGDATAAERSEVRQAVKRFIGVGLIALVVVALPASLWIRAEAGRHALANVALMTQRLADYSVGPLVTTALLAGDHSAVASLDARLQPWLVEDSLLRIKVWDATGQIVYSDVPQLIGQRFERPDWWDGLVTDGIGQTALEHQVGPENEFETDSGALVEVYVRSFAATGEPLIFEAYFDDRIVRAEQASVLLDMAPAFLLSLAILQLAQLGPAIRLARLIQVHQATRRRLLRHAVAASDLERQRIARDLHDEVIQELAGLSYALEAEERHGAPGQGPLFAQARSILQGNIRTLRAITRELYPPDLELLGLPRALARLTDPLLEHGTEVTLRVPDDCDLDREGAALFYRIAREVLTNIVKHSGATRVDLSLTQNDFRTVMIIQDNGCGFDPDAESPNGHLGLRIMRDTIQVAGGTFLVTSSAGGGTSVAASLDRSFADRPR